MVVEKVCFYNKKIHVTLPALASFDIIARHKGLGGFSNFLLPLRQLSLIYERKTE